MDDAQRLASIDVVGTDRRCVPDSHTGVRSASGQPQAIGTHRKALDDLVRPRERQGFLTGLCMP